MSEINIIVAHSFGTNGIGIKGELPWYIKEDLKRFRTLTCATPSSNIVLNYDANTTYSIDTTKTETQMQTMQNTNINVIPDIKYMNAIIMGRKSWDCLPERFKPLPNRINVIITNNKDLIELTEKLYKIHNSKDSNNFNDSNNMDTIDNIYKSPVIYAQWNTYEQELIRFQNHYNNLFLNVSNLVISQQFIIGGEQIYKLALSEKLINRMYITEVYLPSDITKNIVFDAFFPKYDSGTTFSDINKFHISQVSQFYCGDAEKNIWFRFFEYNAITSRNPNTSDIIKPWINKEETQYLSIMENILTQGIEETDRTGVGTISIFGTLQTYDLRDTLPLTTTKRIPFRFIFEELALYISGKTDNKILQSKGVHIWDGNTSREFLDKRGLTHYETGDMGETYGFNMRHYGAEYKGCGIDYPLDGSYGFDQIANVIKLIKTEPTSRRIIINLWNPATEHKAALPSCLFYYQFKVNTKAKLLNLNIVLRSSDYFLANNWNTITGALLVHMICNLNDIDLSPGMLNVITNDTHIYKTHIEQVRANLNRIPYPYPKLIVKSKHNKLEEFIFDDFELLGYKAHPGIKADMAI